MKTTVTQMKAANDSLYQSMRTMNSFSRDERADAAKVAHEMSFVTKDARNLATLLAAGVRHSNGTVHEVNRAYALMSSADDMADNFNV